MCITEDKSNKKTRGRSRTKTRKPKYLSLSKQLEKPSSEKEITKMTQQLNLFPLQPEQINDKSFADHHENVALLFDPESIVGDETLTGILRPSPENERSPSSYERTYDSESLVKAAMKSRRNDNDGDQEEKWVCYSEVVEEVTSSSSKKAVVFDRRSKNKKRKPSNNKVETKSSNSEGNSVISANSSSSTTSLALKLDYEGILNAWSDKGSLYIKPHQNLSSLQTVPDLLHCDHNGLMEGGWGSSVGNLWKVPENDDIKIKEESEVWKIGQREASVLRYKEKRQNRLFSKKIRYQVRKLNAEKRPRMKGRFVKTC